jgi:solute carrier family 25 S-adenosylmethionine transporter 26
LTVVKQNASEGARPTVLRRFKTIYVEEGWRALFSGVVPRTLWISAGGAVFLGMYELTMNNLLLG